MSGSISHAALTACVASLLVGHAIGQNAPSGASGATTTTGAAGSTCSWQQKCPTTAPCCSDSGVGCLNGCNVNTTGIGYPNLAHESSMERGGLLRPYPCLPIHKCESYTFADTSRIALNSSAYTGDAAKYDFTLDKQDGTTSLIQDGELALTLTEAGGGTRLSTTRAVLYGNIQASIKTVGAPGIVTAFITMSGSKDEIDWEWTGTDRNEAQSNYFWEGDLNDYKNGGTAETSSNRANNYIVYGFNWTPDQLQWTVAGKVVRTLTRSSTYDSASGRYEYPQTPSRIQMSVWPAGIVASAPGTVTWAGGMIDWSKAPFQARIQWISLQCYSGLNLSYEAGNTTSSFNSSSRLAKREIGEKSSLWKRGGLVERADSINSYVWGVNNSAGQIQVTVSNAATIINSVYSTGKNMIVKGSDTKGVIPTNESGNALSNSALGSWWYKLPTAAKAGIIAGIVLATLFLIVALCTCVARRKDSRKAKAYKPVGDAISLNKTSAAPVNSRTQASTASLASTMTKNNTSAYDQSNYAHPQAQRYDLAPPAPEWPTAQNDYDQQQGHSSPSYYSYPEQTASHGNYYDGSHTPQASQWPHKQHQQQHHQPPQQYYSTGAKY
ncbi:BQ5605_C029g10613 [Microbotryum silenes-dioicae]|uniref:BQ5605_C029g10613 protein n=1 Tax=Microbotryum silenes-dioicae TaxID=796604 RepID=A0A2X0MJ18_9BASI|nr:BQ5605_C029g10613 [Microbotryum silenes-dioicae]